MRLLLAILRPLRNLGTVARELTIMRELYEADLAQRQPPIFRVTEKPRKQDTEVSYAGMPVAKRSSWKWLAQVEDDEEMEEEVEE